MIWACLPGAVAIYYQKIVYNISRRLLSPSYITLIIYIYKYKIIAYYSFLCYRCNFCMLTKMLTKEKEYTCDYAQSHICILFLLFIYYTPSTLSYYYLSEPLRSKQEIIVHRFTYTRRVYGEVTHIY